MTFSAVWIEAELRIPKRNSLQVLVFFVSTPKCTTNHNHPLVIIIAECSFHFDSKKAKKFLRFLPNSEKFPENAVHLRKTSNWQMEVCLVIIWKIPQNYSSEQNQSLVETWVPLFIFPSDKLFTCTRCQETHSHNYVWVNLRIMAFHSRTLHGIKLVSYLEIHGLFPLTVNSMPLLNFHSFGHGLYYFFKRRVFM